MDIRVALTGGLPSAGIVWGQQTLAAITKIGPFFDEVPRCAALLSAGFTALRLFNIVH
ncbi:hypothetical protein [Stutzerimonas stutzeri]|uniref:hypothetical protein n=1 Tax=Stutzerimonas stutzeri TaxID=316 RepID=UPI00163B55FE|nr:hypothetical protein [Stutzerimonas stutzeri]